MKSKYYSPITFSNRLTILMYENNLNQTTLAKRIGVERKTIGSWENGVSSPNANMIIKLCFALHTNADYLIGLSNERTAPEEAKDMELIYEEMLIAERLKMGRRCQK